MQTVANRGIGLSWLRGLGSPRAGALRTLVLVVTATAGLSFAPGALALEGDTIAGVVTDASTHAGIVGIEVCASALNAEPVEGPERCAQTTSGGVYSLSGLESGRYRVEFSTPTQSELNYVTQYYNGASTPGGATPVTVSEATGATGIDAALKAGGRITGRVTDASTGAPIGEIVVCAIRSPFEGIKCASTHANGEYSIASLAGGQYMVVFSTQLGRNLNYITQYYNGQLSQLGATQVEVRAEGTTAGIDAALQAGGQISGTVTDASSGAAIPKAFVCALSLLPEVTECAFTNEVGHYLISGLPSANYQVRFSAGRGYLVQYYNAKYSRAEASVLGVFAGELKTGIDAAMQSVPAALPLNTGAPAVSGKPTVGDSLSCSTGSWTGKPPPTFTYQWLHDGTPIEGATESAYTVQESDLTHTISCLLTATNVVGRASASSAGVLIAPPASERPSVTILTRRFVVTGRSIDVRVACAHARCIGRIALGNRVPRKTKGSHYLISSAIAVGSFSLAPGQQRTVALRLRGKRALGAFIHARKHPVTARLEVSVRGGDGIFKNVLIR